MRTCWRATRRPGDSADLESPGFFRVRKGGEPHTKDKDTVQALNDLTLVQEKDGDGQDREMLIAHLRSAIRSESSGLPLAFAVANDRTLVELHDLLELVPPQPIPVDEVEPAAEIVKRFTHQGHVARGPVQGGPRPSPRP